MKKRNLILLSVLILEIIVLSIIYKTQISLSLILTSATIVSLLIINIFKKSKKIDVVLLLCFIVAISFMPYLLKINIFCFFNDQYVQYDYFSEEWSRLLTNFIKNRSLPFYSFNSFLGNNYFGSKSYYITGNILFPIVMLFNSVNEGHLFETEILVVLSGLFTYLYLEKFGIKKSKVLIASSVIYAFSGISAAFSSQYFWHRFIAILPLLLFAVEVYRENKKTTIFSIAVCLCFLINYYYMFPTSIFLIIYFIFTYYYHDENLKLKIIFKKSIKLLFSYILGFMLSGIIIIPTLYSIFGNNRVGSGINNSILFDFKVYLGYLYNMIIAPLSLGTKFTNNFISSEDYHLWGYTIYLSSILAPVTFSYLFVHKDERRNKILRNLIIIITVISLIPITNSIMHGFSGASLRVTFLAAFVYLIGFAAFFDRESVDIYTFIKGYTTYCIVFVIMTIAAVVMNIMPIDLTNTQLINAIICLILLSLFIYLLKKGKTTVVLILCCVETIFMFNMFLCVANSEFSFYEDSLDRNVISYINDQDEDKFYRIDVNTNNLTPYTKDLNLNQSLHYGYKSLDSYDTTYENNLNEFLEMGGINGHIINIENPEIKRMLGTRYFYVQNESELPKGYEFSYITNNNNFKVYKLNNYKPIGFTYSAFTKDKNSIIKNNTWNNMLYVNEDLFNQVKDIKDGENYCFELKEYYDDNNLKGTIITNDKRILFLSIPYNEGWRVKDNGEYTKIFKVQGGFIGVVIEAGEHNIELNFIPQGFKIGCIISLLGLVGIFIVSIFEKRKKTRDIL